MDGRWMLLVYRVPREPSTPRIAIWRTLRRLGVAQLGDGLVALPLDARNRDRLERVAEEVVEAGGTAAVWLAEPALRHHARDIIAELAAARAEEYREVTSEAQVAMSADDTLSRRRTLRRLRRRLRDIGRRDYFPPPERAPAVRALDQLARSTTAGEAAPAGGSAR